MTDSHVYAFTDSARVLAPEAEFVYLASRVRPKPGELARVGELLAPGIDLQRALRHARFHGVLPLVGRTLDQLPQDLIPEPVREELSQHLRWNAAGNLHKFAALAELSQRLEAGGIRTLHFKGPLLAGHAFGDLGLRMFADLDVLVRPEDARAARDRMLADGFVSTLSPEGEAFHLARSYWLGLRHPSGEFQVDLHWKLADPFFRYEPDLDTLWRNSQTVVVAGVPVGTFSAEDTVSVLAAHGFKHAYSRLKWICDLSEWIRVHPELDWSVVRATARSLHVERILSVSLGLVHAYDTTVLPVELVAAAAEDRRVAGLTRRVWGAIFHGDRPLAGIRAEWFHAQGRERRWDGWNYLRNQGVRRFKRAVVPNEKDRAAVPLPRPLGFLHYAVRPVRLGLRLASGQGPDR